MRFDDDPASVATDLTDQLESRARSAIKGIGSFSAPEFAPEKILKGPLFKKIQEIRKDLLIPVCKTSPERVREDPPKMTELCGISATEPLVPARTCQHLATAFTSTSVLARNQKPAFAAVGTVALFSTPALTQQPRQGGASDH
jgi:hypothetical protein